MEHGVIIYWVMLKFAQAFLEFCWNKGMKFFLTVENFLKFEYSQNALIFELNIEKSSRIFGERSAFFKARLFFQYNFNYFLMVDFLVFVILVNFIDGGCVILFLLLLCKLH